VEAIHNNPILVEKLIWFFASVIKAGPPPALVLGSSWDPADTALDLLCLAQSDRSKSLLFQAVAPLASGLLLRSSNLYLVQYSLSTLALLTFEPKCKAEFDKVKKELLACQNNLQSLVLPELSKRELAYLMDWLVTGVEVKAAARRPSLLHRVASVVSVTSSKSSSPGKHAFASHSWADHAKVLKAQEFLNTRHLPVWMDKCVFRLRAPFFTLPQ